MLLIFGIIAVICVYVACAMCLMACVAGVIAVAGYICDDDFRKLTNNKAIAAFHMMLFG